MDERPDQIVEQIHHQREQLGEHLSELEDKVHEAADWRTHYRQHPYMFVGAAFGGGLLLSGMLSRSRRSNGNSYRYSEPTATSQIANSLSPLKAALIGFGASKLRDVLNEFLPGIRDHWKT